MPLSCGYIFDTILTALHVTYAQNWCLNRGWTLEVKLSQSLFQWHQIVKRLAYKTLTTSSGLTSEKLRIGMKTWVISLSNFSIPLFSFIFGIQRTIGREVPRFTCKGIGRTQVSVWWRANRLNSYTFTAFYHLQLCAEWFKSKSDVDARKLLIFTVTGPRNPAKMLQILQVCSFSGRI